MFANTPLNMKNVADSSSSFENTIPKRDVTLRIVVKMYKFKSPNLFDRGAVNCVIRPPIVHNIKTRIESWNGLAPKLFKYGDKNGRVDPAPAPLKNSDKNKNESGIKVTGVNKIANCFFTDIFSCGNFFTFVLEIWLRYILVDFVLKSNNIKIKLPIRRKIEVG